MKRALLVLPALLGLVCVGPAFADWAPSLFDRKSAIQGCAIKSTEDTWACAFILCQRGRPLKLYLDVPGSIGDGPIALAVDDRRFELALEFSKNPFGDAHQVIYVDPDFFEAIGKGKLLRILQGGLKPGYDAIPLKGLGPALDKLTKSCGPSR